MVEIKDLAIELNSAAAILQMHPRTVLRHMTGDPNVYWTDDHNPVLKLGFVAAAFQCDPLFLSRTINERDAIFTESEAAEFLDLLPRTFRNHKYTPIIRQGRVVRYSRVALANEHFSKWD